jgi:hypothetical protein
MQKSELVQAIVRLLVMALSDSEEEPAQQLKQIDPPTVELRPTDSDEDDSGFCLEQDPLLAAFEKMGMPLDPECVNVNRKALVRMRLPSPDELEERAREMALPVVTPREYEVLMDLRMEIEPGLTTDDPQRMKEVLRKLDEIITRGLSGYVKTYERLPDSVDPAPHPYFGVEQIFERLLRALGVEDQRTRIAYARGLADALEEYDQVMQSEGYDEAYHC